MAGFSIGDMLAMQRALQEKYKDTWERIEPATGQNKLLWMLGEAGEVIDLLKKHSPTEILETADLRAHFVEELADVLMYYNDILLCFGLSEEELQKAYVEKFHRNMQRW